MIEGKYCWMINWNVSSLIKVPSGCLFMVLWRGVVRYCSMN